MRQYSAHGHPDHDACGTGFVCRLGAKGSHEVVDRALSALQRLAHRGGVDADGTSGDGAGLLTAIPDRFIRRAAADRHITLPSDFGLGMLFLDPRDELRTQRAFAALATEMDLKCLAWREVPVNDSVPGSRAAETLPAIWQCFVAAKQHVGDLESSLFLLRKRAEAELGERSTSLRSRRAPLFTRVYCCPGNCRFFIPICTLQILKARLRSFTSVFPRIPGRHGRLPNRFVFSRITAR